jgi:hypothetical protein
MGDFLLPEEDMEFIEESHYSCQTVIEGAHRWLVIDDYPIPNGYNFKSAKLALRIDVGYPNSQIDMVYFYPPLQRIDGKPIGALVSQPLVNLNFQRWSRHRTPQNPWRPGIDNLQTHLLLVDYWLQREFQIR